MSSVSTFPTSSPLFPANPTSRPDHLIAGKIIDKNSTPYERRGTAGLASSLVATCDQHEVMRKFRRAGDQLRSLIARGRVLPVQTVKDG